MRSPSRWSRSGCRARRSRARIGPALAAVGLAGFEHRDPTSLSGGEKQRLAIASVLALQPAVIVLDEPTTDLDPEGKAEVFALIRSLREQGFSLIVIEHEAEELRDCDRIVLLREGEIIAAGAPRDLMTRLELLEECGVHPPDLNRVLATSGSRHTRASVDEAEALIRTRPAECSPLPADPARRPTESAMEPRRQRERRKSAGRGPRRSSFAYPDGPPVLDGIDLPIAPGEFVAIIGQNGSGKTTLAKHLVGLLHPTAGAVMLDGRDRASAAPGRDRARKSATSSRTPTIRFSPRRSRTRSPSGRATSASRRLRSSGAAPRCCAPSACRMRARAIPFCSARASASGWRSRVCWRCDRAC